MVPDRDMAGVFTDIYPIVSTIENLFLHTLDDLLKQNFEKIQK
jgi:hypothetical protein